MFKRFKEKKRNNKGFTLVELVVVVAILAILVGLLAPQYTKYVERARQSADANTLENMVRATELAATDPVSTLQPGSYTIKLAENVTVGPEGDGKAIVEKAIKNALGDNALKEKIKSKIWKNDGITATITVDAGDTDPEKTGAVTVTYSPESFANYVGKTVTSEP